MERAYEQLIAEGWLTSRPGSGTYVVRLPSIRAPHAIRVPEPPQASTLPLISLRPGVPWTPPRASAAWKRAWRTAGAHPPPANYPDPAGEPALRAAIASLLGRARGLHTGPESILVTSGTVHGLGLTLAALTPPTPATKPYVAIEDPGYGAAVASAGHFGWSVHDVPVDRHGLEVDKLHHAPAPRARYT